MTITPVYEMTDSWDNGLTYDAVRMEVSDNSSNTDSRLLMLSATSGGKIEVDKYGCVNCLTLGYGSGAISSNTVVGNGALANNTTGCRNTAVGYQSLNNNTCGRDNTAVGYQSLYCFTYGSPFGNGQNTAVGSCALYSNATGNRTTAVGYQSLYSNTTGTLNAAHGYLSLSCNTTGSANTAHGYQSLSCNTTGGSNTAQGSVSLFNNTTGSCNIAVGAGSLFNNTTGSCNTSVGALFNNTTGSCNTSVGANAGDPINGANNTISVGFNASPDNTDHHTVWGNASNNVCNCVYTAWSNVSDCNDKSDVNTLPPSYGIDFIRKLNPVSYKWDHRDQYVTKCCCNYGEKDGSLKSTKCHYGFIAQDIKSTLDDLGIKFDGLGYDENKDAYRLTYEELLAPIVLSIKQLIANNELLSNKILELETRVNSSHR